MRQVVLASGSPRRQELLEKMGVDFIVVPSNFEEKLVDNRFPSDVAKELSLGKARSVAEKYPEAVVIGSDCILTVEGRQLGKPVDDDDARKTLQLLAGNICEVSTGVAIVCKSEGIQLLGVDTAHVQFNSRDDDAIEEYISTGDHRGKAGSFGVQDPSAAPLIANVTGDIDTIMGLPTTLLARLLSQVDIPARPVKFI